MRLLEASGQYNNLIYLKGWTWDVIDYVRSFEKPIEILFVDSWHQYEYAMRDWNLYRPLLARPALVICDDITTDRGPVIDRMDEFWEKLPGQKFLTTALHRANIPMGVMYYA